MPRSGGWITLRRPTWMNSGGAIRVRRARWRARRGSIRQSWPSPWRPIISSCPPRPTAAGRPSPVRPGGLGSFPLRSMWARCSGVSTWRRSHRRGWRWGGRNGSSTVQATPERLLAFHPIVLGDQVLVCDGARVLAYNLNDRPGGPDGTESRPVTSAWKYDSDNGVSAPQAPRPYAAIPRYTLTALGHRIYARMGTVSTFNPGGRGFGRNLQMSEIGTSSIVALDWNAEVTVVHRRNAFRGGEDPDRASRRPAQRFIQVEPPRSMKSWAAGRRAGGDRRAVCARSAATGWRRSPRMECSSRSATPRRPSWCAVSSR